MPMADAGEHEVQVSYRMDPAMSWSDNMGQAVVELEYAVARRFRTNPILVSGHRFVDATSTHLVIACDVTVLESR